MKIKNKTIFIVEKIACVGSSFFKFKLLSVSHQLAPYSSRSCTISCLAGSLTGTTEVPMKSVNIGVMCLPGDVESVS